MIEEEKYLAPVGDILDIVDALTTIKVWSNILMTYCEGLRGDDEKIGNEVTTLCCEIFFITTKALKDLESKRASYNTLAK